MKKLFDVDKDIKSTGCILKAVVIGLVVIFGIYLIIMFVALILGFSGVDFNIFDILL